MSLAATETGARTPGRKAVIAGVAAAFLVQAALLVWMVVDRALLLSRGTEIRLAALPVDPRDLFRGDYVVLRYALSQLRSDALERADALTHGDTVYVTLRRDGADFAPVTAQATPPDGGLFLKGKIEGVRHPAGCAKPCRVYYVAYNLEKFFVPEGRGRALERLRNDQRLEVDVAVGTNGRAALQRLLVDGRPRYEDKLL